jgi:hypothetical protein
LAEWQVAIVGAVEESGGGNGGIREGGLGGALKLGGGEEGGRGPAAKEVDERFGRACRHWVTRRGLIELLNEINSVIGYRAQIFTSFGVGAKLLLSYGWV